MTIDVELEAILNRADFAAVELATTSPAERSAMLHAMADAMDAAGDELVSTADRESRLGETRLRGELRRTTFQLRFLGDEVATGHPLEIHADSSDAQWPSGPRPAMSRMLVPVGPVVVMAAGNFPFAFSVAGGDTASALAAGCPVVLKTHPGHPETSRLTADLVAEALRTSGAPEGTFATISSTDDVRTALEDPRIRAGAFTGSASVGRDLQLLCAGRPEPIPFYGELGSVNPVLVLQSALDSDRDIVSELAASMTMGVGQFCTQPGVVFAPAAAELGQRLAVHLTGSDPAEMLNPKGAQEFAAGLGSFADRWETLLPGEVTGQNATPAVFRTSVAAASADWESAFEECFGPSVLVMDYNDETELASIAATIPNQLTTSIQTADDDPLAAELLPVLARRAGRVCWNQWPTGVAVSWAMQHGGDWPATTASLHSSVGSTSIRRFLRPVCYQAVPDSLLPDALQPHNPQGLVRRVDGRMQLGGDEEF